MDEIVSVGNKRMDVVGSSNKKSRKVRKAKTSKKKMILVLKGQEKKIPLMSLFLGILGSLVRLGFIPLFFKTLNPLPI